MFLRLYDAVIALSAHRRAPAYLSALSFAESSVFPIPPDVMLIPMCLARPLKSWLYAMLCTLFSVLGGMAGYLIGKLAFGWIEPWLMGSGYADTFTSAVNAFETWGFWYILLAGFTPIPYKVFTISAGVVGMPFLAFIGGSVVGRGGRFFLVAGLIRLGGEKLASRMRKYIDLIGWIMIVLAVIVFAALSSGCSHHQPAAVEEHSVTPIKRQMNSDGSYDVRSGDTLYAIAFNYGMDPRNLAKWNGISSPYVIYPGQNLRLSAPPVGSHQSGGSSAVQISAVKTPGQANTRAVTSPAKPPASQSTQAKTTPKPTASSTKKTTVPAKTTMSSTTDPKSWKWPTSGRLLRGYVAGDPARNGLDIAGKEGQAISASSGGQVVYSGNGLIGYGELIIIKHSEKMLSAYAHNKVRLVQEGDRVSAGQKVAEMGRNSGGEQLLHFEIRAHGKPVNPLNYLPKK